MTTLNQYPVRYQTTTVDGVEIFHREAGNPANSTLLLLTGFPSGSHTFGNLINDLKGDFHLLAPDYPGFGHSATPAATDFDYSFDNLALVLEHWIDAIGLTGFTLYAHDYGGPIGFRIAARRPELIQSLIVQNAYAYAEGIGPGFEAAMPFLQNRNAETETPIRGLMTLEGVQVFYLPELADRSKSTPIIMA